MADEATEELNKKDEAGLNLHPDPLSFLTRVPDDLTAIEGPGRLYGHNPMTGEVMDRVSLGEAPLLLRKQLFQSNNSCCSWQATKLGWAMEGRVQEREE